MRIAVCAPQVPFVRGAPEIFADTLVDELRARDHETELVTIPFKWYPGTRVLDQAFLWRLLDLDRVGRASDRSRRRRRSSPRTACAIRTSASGCCTSSGRRTSWTDTDLGQFSEEPLRPGAAALGPAVWTGIALGEAKRLFATSRNVADRIERSTGLAPGGDASSAAGSSPYRCEEYGDFVLSVNRLDRAKRIDLLLEAAALDPSLRVVDRRRRARPRRGSRRWRTSAGLNGRAEFTGPDRGEPHSRRSTLAVSPSTTRRSTRTSGWCRTRRSCRRSRC